MTADEEYTRRVFDSHVGPTAGAVHGDMVTVVCDRCSRNVRGILTKECTSGFYDVRLGTWASYGRDGESFICDPCMHKDPAYQAVYPTQQPRFYSEREHPLGPPSTDAYGVGPDGEPLLGVRDQRVWVSIEWAAEHGVDVPDDWREQS